MASQNIIAELDAPAARRGLQEGLRLIAYRAETALAAVLAPHLGKPAEVCALTRTLLQSDASLRPDAAAGTLTVQLQHTACRAHDEALAALLEELNRTQTVYPDTGLRLVYEMLPLATPESPSQPSKNLHSNVTRTGSLRINRGALARIPQPRVTPLSQTIVRLRSSLLNASLSTETGSLQSPSSHFRNRWGCVR